MSLIIPYTTLGKRAYLLQNATNFPALKHQFSCNETSAAMDLVDDITGIRLADSALTTTITMVRPVVKKAFNS